MINFYATFGKEHYGGLLKNYYVQISAKDSEEAKNKMFECFGRAWEELYEQNDFSAKYFIRGRLGKILCP